MKGRDNLILQNFEKELYKYISGIITEKEQKPLAINGMSDHLHILIGLRPSMRISDLVRDIKNNAANFINKHDWLKEKFNWQEGYGAFSYSQSNYGTVIDYIKNQKQHHIGRNLKDEYFGLMQKSTSHMKKNICLNFIVKEDMCIVGY